MKGYLSVPETANKRGLYTGVKDIFPDVNIRGCVWIVPENRMKPKKLKPGENMNMKNRISIILTTRVS